MIKFIKQKNKAFTLVEMMVAVSIFTVSILGMISILASGLSNTSYAKQKMVATYLAQEGIEYMRNMRDTYVLYQPSTSGWNYFFNLMINDTISGGNNCSINNGCYFLELKDSDYNNLKSPMAYLTLDYCNENYCSDHHLLYKNLTGEYGYDNGGIDSGFSRQIKAERIANDEIKITSTVYWHQGSGLKSVMFSENLTNA